MASRRLVLGLVLTLVLALPGCGWTPLYADRAAGPAAADLRAIQVAPIPERIGQHLELALRDALNPQGIPTPARYLLSSTVQTTQSDFGIQSQGLGTLGQVDVIDTFQLKDSKTGQVLLTNTLHVNESFDILANGYATVVSQNAATARCADELRDEIVARLTMFMQRHATAGPVKS